MFIKSLELHNIRSYEHQIIPFKKGTTLLSGDIGSGKTTILIALEFALFGILRGKTQPSELLRHSSKEGSISLHLEIAGKDVRITRGLKRGSSSISQVPGTILLDGVEETYVATELKARILQLLGYPESLLSKSTNLFRYTVYTPQEQVKQILHETIEERKDIIRKIFGIDKYKRVVENTSPYVVNLRERIARSKGRTDDTKMLIEQQLAQKKELVVLSEQKKPLEESLNSAKKRTVLAKEEYDVQRKILDEQRKEVAKQQVAMQKLTGEKKLLMMIEQQHVQLETRIKKTELKEIKYTSEKKEKIIDALAQLSSKKLLVNKKYGELDVKERQSKELQQKILNLTTCPTCQQTVGVDHKDHITSEQEKIILVVNKKRTEYDNLTIKIKEKEDSLNLRLKEEQELEKKHYLFLQQKQQQAGDISRLEQLAKQFLEKQKSIIVLEKEQENKKEIILLDMKQVEQNYESLIKQEQQLELTLREQTTKEDVAKRLLETLEKTILEKKTILKQIISLTEIRTWVQELFVPLVKTIEKRVLLNIYQEFNSYFTQWFSMLIDDETLVVRLDEDFTPLIEQHGYDTTVGNLSGGEKTSVALAYRLALNKVLNDYFGTLHTKGLLILDEPTDGFSSQQLDKLRDVLDEIGVEQVIVVSHEPKLESIADNLINIIKEHQISTISHS